eukprot:332151-Hanusia_phi.AAC.1
MDHPVQFFGDFQLSSVLDLPYLASVTEIPALPGGGAARRRTGPARPWATGGSPGRLGRTWHPGGPGDSLVKPTVTVRSQTVPGYYAKAAACALQSHNPNLPNLPPPARPGSEFLSLVRPRSEVTMALSRYHGTEPPARRRVGPLI